LRRLLLFSVRQEIRRNAYHLACDKSLSRFCLLPVNARMAATQGFFDYSLPHSTDKTP
jgi:hypothetical protein